jgi:hypothetical protein
MLTIFVNSPARRCNLTATPLTLTAATVRMRPRIRATVPNTAKMPLPSSRVSSTELPLRAPPLRRQVVPRTAQRLPLMPRHLAAPPVFPSPAMVRRLALTPLLAPAAAPLFPSLERVRLLVRRPVVTSGDKLRAATTSGVRPKVSRRVRASGVAGARTEWFDHKTRRSALRTVCDGDYAKVVLSLQNLSVA